MSTTDNKKKRKLEEDDEATDSSPPSKKQKLNDGEKAASSKEKESENKKIDLNLADLPLNIIFLTGNQGKLAEVQNYVGDEIKKYIINHKVDLEEIQGNEKEILTKKLMSARKVILEKLEATKIKIEDKQIYILVEDTSLYLSQYSKNFNFPGPFCKFALKANKCQAYIDMVKNHDDKSCTALCLFGLLKITKDEKNEPLFFEGKCEGTVTDKERGDKGFGWDPIFECKETKKTFAEMTQEEKNKISHRANALKILKQHLDTEIISKLKK